MIPKVLIVIKDGVASYFVDGDVVVHLVDLDDCKLTGEAPDIPDDFRALAEEADIEDEGEEQAPRQMYCWGCRKTTMFTVEDADEGPVCECGHYQDTEASGAAEICRLAMWHDLDEYNRVAKIARDGGYIVPETPNRFEP